MKIIEANVVMKSCNFTQNIMRQESSGINAMYSNLQINDSFFDMAYHPDDVFLDPNYFFNFYDF